MLKPIKKASEYKLYNFACEIVVLGEELQKLRVAKKMLADGMPREKACQYLKLDLEDLDNLEEKLSQREKVYHAFNEKQKEYIEYGIKYTNKIIISKMTLDKKDNNNILKYANESEDYINKKRLEKFFFLSWHFPGVQCQIGQGRWATIEEEENMNHANCFDTIAQIGDTQKLDKDFSILNVSSVIKREPEFNGFLGFSSDNIFIISQEELNLIVKYSNFLKKKRMKEEIKEDIENYKYIIQQCETKGVHDAAEIPKLIKQYNDLYNEGGEGYVPHFYSHQEYEGFKMKLAELLKQQNDLENE